MQRWIFPAILLVYLVVGVLYAALTPAWQAPDEPAHYNYVRQAAFGGCCPLIQRGDWDSAYLDRLKANAFSPELLGRLESIQYEDHQPPLYYLLLAPLYGWTGGNLVILRIVGVLLGMVVVACAWWIARRLAPDRVWIAAGAAAFAAFLPQHLHILASVNNDALAWALIALTLAGTVKYLFDTAAQRHREKTEELNTKAQRHKGTKEIFMYLLLTPYALLLTILVGALFSANATIPAQPLFTLLLIAALIGAGVMAWRLRDQPDELTVWMLGVLVGLIFVTKTTGYFLAAVVPLAIWLRWRTEQSGGKSALDVGGVVGKVAGEALKHEPVRKAGAFIARKGAEALAKSPALREAAADAAGEAAKASARGLYQQMRGLLRLWALFLIPALLLGALWWGRNLTVYGVPDFLGLREHDAVVVGQLRTEDKIEADGFSEYVGDLAGTTFTSFWGQFGWMALPLAGWMLLFVQVITALIIGGWGITLGTYFRHRGTEAQRQNASRGVQLNASRNTLIILAVSGVLAILAFLYYNTEFVQFQGRYTYAGMIPFALAAAFGLAGWARLLGRIPALTRWLTARKLNPQTATGWLCISPLLALMPFALYALWRVIVPGLGG